MENNPPQNPEPFGPPNPVPPSPAPPQNLPPYQHAPAGPPKIRIVNYLFAGFGILIVLAIFLPNSVLAQSLAYPIIILGGISGVVFFVESIKSSQTMSPLVRPFVIFGGFGVGVFIFFTTLIVGAIVGFSKDPNPQGCG